MRKTTLLMLILLIQFPLVLSAQGMGTVKGRVTDTDGKGLNGAYVFIEATSRGIYVEDDGYFLIDKLLPGAHKLVVKADDYSSKEEIVLVEAGQVAEKDIKLEKENNSFFDFIFYNILRWLIKQF